MADKKILIIFWDGWLGISPSLINGMRLLVKDGCSLKIILGKRHLQFAEPPSFKNNVELIYIPISEKKYKNYKGSLFSKIKFNMDFFLSRLNFVYHCLKQNILYRPNLIIGIDREGCIFSGIINTLFGAHYIYWSLETSYIENTEFLMDRWFKKLEKFFHNKALFTIIQDKYRADSLIKENNITNQDMVLVPNGPLGYPKIKASRYFHDKFNLKDNQKLILHLGIIDSSVMSLDLAKTSSKWQGDFKLVFHEREFKFPENDKYLEKVIDAGKDKTLFSLQPVEYDLLDEVVSSADIGIVIYDKKYGPNYSLISGASGKIGHYLRCGLPVVCLNLPGFSELIDKYNCGLVIEHLSEIEHCIKQIYSDYENFRKNALLCYKEHFEFSNNFNNVIERLSNLN